MNAMIVASHYAGKKMTSLDISELVESSHDSVKRTIERIAEKKIIKLPSTVKISTATKPTSVYLLEKGPSLIVAANLCLGFTVRVVQRWQELEAKGAAQPAYQLPSNFKEALLQLVAQEELTEQLRLTLQEQAPKVAIADAISESNETISLVHSTV